MNTTTRAAVDVSVAYAVAQQDLFFAACVAGETLYQQGNMPSDFKGRPTFQSIALPCGLLVGAFLAIQTDNAVVSPGGLVLGAGACLLAGKGFLGAFYTLVPVRPRSRGERRSLRTFPVVSLRPGSLAFNPDTPRRLSTSTDAFQLHPDIRSYGRLPSDRFDAMEDDGMDWPGPRVYPGTGILFALFALLANVEALPRILSGY